MGSYQYSSSAFVMGPAADDPGGKLAEFHRFLHAQSKGEAKNVCIFCTGNWGIRLYRELTSRLVQVNFFCDNDPEKHGYVLEGVWCIPFEKLLERKDDTLVIVSTVNPDPIVDQLYKHGFPYILRRQDIAEQLSETPPVKWMTALEGVENIDYSSSEITALVEKFKQTIYDVCMYYEDQLKKYRE